MYNNLPTRFNQSDVFTDYMVQITSRSEPNVTAGQILSTLHIKNIQNPADYGEYTCIGANSYSGITSTSLARITVQNWCKCSIVNVDFAFSTLKFCLKSTWVKIQLFISYCCSNNRTESLILYVALIFQNTKESGDINAFCLE